MNWNLWTGHASRALLALALLSGSSLWADEEKEAVKPQEDGAELVINGITLNNEEKANSTITFEDGSFSVEGAKVELHATTSKFWLGVGCEPITAPLQAQLGIEHGLVVQEVVDDSPAKHAGLHQHDILLRIGDTDVAAVEQLVQAVDKLGASKAEVVFLRGGKKQTLGVKLAERPQDKMKEGEKVNRFWLSDITKAVESKPGEKEAGTIVFQDLSRNPGEKEEGGVRMLLVRPGVVVPAEATGTDKLPKNLTIMLKRAGEEPTMIEVHHDGKTWKVNEHQIGDLPADVQPHVKRMLGLPVDVRVRWTEALEKGAASATEKGPMKVFGYRIGGDDVKKTETKSVPQGITFTPAHRAVVTVPALGEAVERRVLTVRAAESAGETQQMAEVNKKLDQILKATQRPADVDGLRKEVDHLRREVEQLRKELDRK